MNHQVPLTPPGATPLHPPARTQTPPAAPPYPTHPAFPVTSSPLTTSPTTPCAPSPHATPPPPAPHSLQDLPDLIVDRIATAAGPPARLICRRLRDCAPITSLHPLPPPHLPLDAFLAATTSPTLLRPLSALNLRHLPHPPTPPYHFDYPSPPTPVAHILSHAAAHCTALRTLHLDHPTGPLLALLTHPASALPRTLQHLPLQHCGSLAALPHDIAPLPRLTALRSLTFDMPDDRLRHHLATGRPLEHLLGPLLALSRLTHLRLDWPSLHADAQNALPRLIAAHLPHLLDLRLYAMVAWDEATAAHVRTMTALTHLELLNEVLSEDAEALCPAVAALPQLAALALWRLNKAAVATLPALFERGPYGAGMQEQPQLQQQLAHQQHQQQLAHQQHQQQHDLQHMQEQHQQQHQQHNQQQHQPQPQPDQHHHQHQQQVQQPQQRPPPCLRLLHLGLATLSYEDMTLAAVTGALHGAASAVTCLSISGASCQFALCADSGQCLRQLAAALPALQELHLEDIRMEDVPLSPLSALAGTLTALTIAGCGRCDPAGLGALTRLRRLCMSQQEPHLLERWQAHVLSQLPGVVVE